MENLIIFLVGLFLLVVFYYYTLRKLLVLKQENFLKNMSWDFTTCHGIKVKLSPKTEKFLGQVEFEGASEWLINFWYGRYKWPKERIKEILCGLHVYLTDDRYVGVTWLKNKSSYDAELRLIVISTVPEKVKYNLKEMTTGIINEFKWGVSHVIMSKWVCLSPEDQDTFINSSGLLR